MITLKQMEDRVSGMGHPRPSRHSIKIKGKVLEVRAYMSSSSPRVFFIDGKRATKTDVRRLLGEKP